MPEFNFPERWQRTSKALEEAGLGGAILTSEPSVYYLSGTMGSRPPGLIVSADPKTKPVLVCRGSERDSVASLTDLEVIGAGYNTHEVLGDAVKKMGLDGEPIGFEDAAMTYGQGTALQEALPHLTFRPASDVVNRLRLVKDADEIAYMKETGKVSDLAMMAAIHTLKTKKSETLAAAAAETTMREFGMFIAYETLIGSGFRSSLLRRFPNHTVPDPDDIIKCDLAAKQSFASGYGYHTDQTRSFTTGKPSPEKLDMLKATQEIQEVTLAALKPGKTIKEVSLEGLSVVKGTKFEDISIMAGHGIGLDVHEWPSFNETTEVVLAPGQCYAIEPHINMPGVQTTCFEDTLVITETGYERITQLPYELWG